MIKGFKLVHMYNETYQDKLESDILLKHLWDTNILFY